MALAGVVVVAIGCVEGRVVPEGIEPVKLVLVEVGLLKTVEVVMLFADVCAAGAAFLVAVATGGAAEGTTTACLLI